MASAVAVDVHNEAEWLTELITSADRNDKSADLVSAYAESELKRRVDEAVEGYLVTDKTDVPHHIQQELQTASETVTPWWWGFKTLVKYRTPRNYQARLSASSRSRVPVSKDTNQPGLNLWRRVAGPGVPWSPHRRQDPHHDADVDAVLGRRVQVQPIELR